MSAINNAGNINPIFPQNIGDVQTGKAQPQQKPADNAAGGVLVDRVEISRQAKAISKAARVINELPEVRNEAVQKAAQDRAAGTPRVPAAELAAKMLFEDNLK